MYTFRFSGLFPWKRQGTAGSPCPSPGPGLRPPTPEGTRTAPATVSLLARVFNLFALYVQVLKNCKLWARKCHLFRHVNCESHTYARWERKPTHWKEIFSWGKTAETRNSPLPCSAEVENAVICISTLPCVVMAGSLSIETNLQLLLLIYWPLKTDEAIFHTFVKVCCREWIWWEG